MSALRRFYKNAGASDMKLAPTWHNVAKSLFQGLGQMEPPQRCPSGFVESGRVDAYKSPAIFNRYNVKFEKRV